MKKIRWGVLSTANIGMEKVIPAMQQGEYCEMAAIASQSLEKAQAAAAKLAFQKPVVPMMNYWRILKLMRFTFHCQIICMFHGQSKH